MVLSLPSQPPFHTFTPLSRARPPPHHHHGAFHTLRSTHRSPDTACAGVFRAVCDLRRPREGPSAVRRQQPAGCAAQVATQPLPAAGALAVVWALCGDCVGIVRGTMRCP
eukprot:358358-Chlamydomonas_euryale.AAC.2